MRGEGVMLSFVFVHNSLSFRLAPCVADAKPEGRTFLSPKNGAARPLHYRGESIYKTRHNSRPLLKLFLKSIPDWSAF